MSELIQKLRGLYQEITSTQVALKDEFRAELLKLFLENPEVTDLRVSINNHAFNDGSPTHFSLYYEDLEIDSEDEAVREKFITFFAEYDVADFYETMFGDEYERIHFRIKDGELKF